MFFIIGIMYNVLEKDISGITSSTSLKSLFLDSEEL